MIEVPREKTKERKLNKHFLRTGLAILFTVAMLFSLAAINQPSAQAKPNPESGTNTVANEKIDVLISFYEMPGAAEQHLVQSFGGEINRTYNNFTVIAANIPDKAMPGLSNQTPVKSVELDKDVYAVDHDYNEEDEYENSWGIGHINADVVHEEEYLGGSIKVAIIDSGVDYTHRNLASNFVDGELGYDFVEEDEEPMDVYGHGTHVAGSVAAVVDDFGVVGVAPEAQLISLRILDDDGVGSESNTLAALDWILDYNEDNKDNPIRVTNNSYGRGSSSSPLKDAFKALEDDGVLNVAAAGNSGNPGGNNDCIIYPAKYSSVMAIGAVDEDNNRPNWSSTGPDLEVVAPGVSVLSTWNDDESYADPQPFSFDDEYYYKEGSGTSMASPHVAGVAALAWSVDSELANIEIREHLKDTAKDLGDSNEYGYGLVQADGILDIEPVATGNIEGTVKDEEGAAIEEATVVVEETDISATTNGDGYYLLEDVPTGHQEVTASAEGYNSQTTTVTVEKDQTVIQDFNLQAIPTYTVSGTVKDADSNALEGATVTIEETGQSATTDDNGDYEIVDVEEGTYDITAFKSGYISQTKTVTIESDTTVGFILEETEDIAPEIDKFNLEDTSNPAWTRVEVEWVVSDDGGNLATVELEMVDEDGEVADSKTISVSGSEASGVDELRERGGHDQTYEVTLTVTDTDGNSASESDSIEL